MNLALWASCFLGSFQSPIVELAIEPEHERWLKASPLLLETPGAKIIKTDSGFVLIGVGSSVITGKGSTHRLAAEKIAATKARAAIVGQKDGIRVYEKTRLDEETKITINDQKESGKSVSTITQINEEVISGAVKGSEIIAKWYSEDKEVRFVAVVLIINKMGKVIE